MTVPRYDPLTQPLAPPAPKGVDLAQREHVIRVLSESFAADRLTMEQLEERLDQVYQATSVPQLINLLADPRVPGGSLEQDAAGARLARDFAVPDRGVAAAIMGGFDRAAGWVLPRHFKAVAIMGGGVIDLCDARIAPGVSEIEVLALMGGFEILVPDGVRVEVVGMAVMGGFSAKPSTVSLDDPDAPVLRISGFVLMGGVDVKRKEHGKKRQKRYEQALARAEQLRIGGRAAR